MITMPPLSSQPSPSTISNNSDSSKPWRLPTFLQRERRTDGHPAPSEMISSPPRDAFWTKLLRRAKTRRRPLVAIAFVSAVCLPVVGNLSLRKFDFSEGGVSWERNLWSRIDTSREDELMIEKMDGGGDYFEEREDGDIELLFRRELSMAFADEEDIEGFVPPGDLEDRLETEENAGNSNNYDADDLGRNNGSVISPLGKVGGSKSIPAEAAIRPYNLTDVLHAADIYERTYATLIWDPSENVFLAYYSKRHYWASGCAKLLGTIQQLTFMLRHLFPWRFQKDNSPEFAMAISSGDYPAVKVTDCVMGRPGTSPPCARTAPILHFGSVFRKPIFPNMIAMPMPDGHHLTCFENWVRNKKVCSGWRSFEDGGELMFPEAVGKSFAELIPQVVWRGTDFGYLGRISSDLSRPGHDAIENRIDPTTTKRKNALRILRNMYDDLVPRWQGVVHTAEAEAETRSTRSLPWADIKFSDFVENGRKKAAVGSKPFQKWVEMGLSAAGEHLSMKELAQYKYHIDLGGGGGTTWSGTILKLAMPGLLFHHVTPTKDYIHDRMKPWSHYVPVREDLRDLKKKFDWAESHPRVAARIARQATQLAREIGSPEGFEQLFKEDFEEPLRKMIEAYQPSGQYHWRRIMEEVDGDLWKPVMMCTGGGIDGERCPRMEPTKQFGRRNRAPPRP